MANIRLDKVKKRFGSTEVIRGVDIDIKDGEFVVFVGPSGCGKSTLLRLIAGLESVSDGDIRIDDRVVNALEPKERGVAMVFQSYAIFPHMTVRENIAFGLTIRKENKQLIEQKVNEAARMLKMEPLLDRRPSQLSGGQRQRVAIGRAIVREPTVFLFDEPLSNLDAALRMSTRQEIAALHAQLKTTMIYVTHDQVEAMTLADKIVVLKDGEVMQIGAPMELFHEPANQFVAGFIGSPAMNFLDVTVDSVSDTHATVSSLSLNPIAIPLRNRQFRAGEKATLGVRPQHLKPSSNGVGNINGITQLSERLGSETVVDVRLEQGNNIIVALPDDVVLSNGSSVHLDFNAEDAHLFVGQAS